MTEKALVTGASGFVGRYLCRELRRRGVTSVALTRSHASANEADQRIVVHDVCDVAALQTAIFHVSPQFVYHLAGSAMEPTIEGMYRANTLFGASLFSVVEQLAPPPVVIIAGSAAEYGPVASDARGIAEDAPCQPVMTYGIAKLAQTHHALALQKCRPVVARLFNPIGPSMPLHLALGRFAALIATMENDGTLETGRLDVTRDFCDVADTARCLADLAHTPAAFGQVVNICSGMPTSLRSLTQHLITASGKTVHIIENAARGSATRSIASMVGSPNRLAALGITPPRAANADLLRDILKAAR